jgi:hypothetical protein
MSKEKNITYVLSAHGEGSKHEFSLPENFFVHTYVPKGKVLSCTLAKPNEICKDPSKAPGHYLPETFYTNDTLWSDKKKTFYSGVKDCSNNTIVLNIDALKRKINMIEVVDYVNKYHVKNHPGTAAHLHCLYCRDSAGGKRTRRTRRALRTRRRR